MSDFFSNGWSIFVAATTVVSLLACLWLLLIASRRKVMADDNSTGHVWDGDLTELNNPLPRWWMILFVVTVFVGGGYLALYPGLGSNAGTLGWSSEDAYRAEQAAARKSMALQYAPFAGKPAEVLAADPQAMAIGERLFLNNCATCHGSDAKGSKGFPNLTDADWLHGGTPAIIEETIRKGRRGMMPPMAAQVGTGADVEALAHYVLGLSGNANDWKKSMDGQQKFAACAGCHGPSGKGNPAMGAPNLTDDVWLHGWGIEAITAIVNKGKTSIMPAQEGRLSNEQIHVLTAYVWRLSHTVPAVSTTTAPATASR